MEPKKLANQSSPAADIETATETNPARPGNSLIILYIILAALLFIMGGIFMLFILAWQKLLNALPASIYWYYAMVGAIIATLLFLIIRPIQRSADQVAEDPDEQGVPAPGTGQVFMNTAGSIRYHRTVCSQLEGIPFPYAMSPKWQELTPKEVFDQNLLPCEICNPPVIARVQGRCAPIESQVGATGV